MSPSELAAAREKYAPLAPFLRDEWQALEMEWTRIVGAGSGIASASLRRQRARKADNDAKMVTDSFGARLFIALADHLTLSHATAAHTVEHSVRAAADLERENVALERQLEEQSARRTRAERELRQLTNNRIALEQVRTSL